VPTSLLRFVAKRVLYSIPVVIGAIFITFIVSRVLVPDPVRAWIDLPFSGPGADEVIQLYTIRYHFNLPLWQQFLYYLFDTLTGNWGISPTTGRPVLAEIGAYFPPTLELVLVATIISFVVGVPLGALAAVRNKTKIGTSVSTLYLAGLSSPPFLVALLCQFVLSYAFAIFPSVGEISPTIAPPQTITGMMVVDAALEGNWPAFWSTLDHMVLPALSLALLLFGLFARLTRSSMLDILNKDYMRTEKAKGLGSFYVNLVHGLRNALIPPVTILAVTFAQSLGGLLIIEYVFSWPGIGAYAVTAIMNDNFPDIIGVTLIFAIGVVASNFVADLLYRILDPRIEG